jgi:hypothetical protein
MRFIVKKIRVPFDALMSKREITGALALFAWEDRF